MKSPSWYSPNKQTLLFYYSKAFGLGFDPKSLDAPILYGGDYYGMIPAYPLYFLTEDTVKELTKYKMEWFIPFVNKIIDNEDFSLDELVQTATDAGFTPFTQKDIV